MDSHYHRQNVEIVIDIRSELYKRIAELAVEEGIQVETLVDQLVSAGIERHMKSRLEVLERVWTKPKGLTE
jgi:hypothetical protein